MKKTRKLLTLLTLCLITVFMAAATASAAKAPSCAKSVNGYYQKWYENPMNKGHYTTRLSSYGITSKNSKSFNGILTINNLAKSAKVSNVKSSNPRITARYVNDPQGMGRGISIAPDATANGVYSGSSKITFSVKQGGKTYNLSCNYKSAKMPTPFKSLVVNGKNYASSLTGEFGKLIKTGKTASISFTAKKNVKDLAITYTTSKGKTVKVKNGAKLTVPKNGLYITVSYKWKGSVYSGDMTDAVNITLSR